MQPRKPLKRSEWLLFLTPLLMLGVALTARPLRLKLFPVPTPAPVPAPVPPPPPNLYSNISGMTDRPITRKGGAIVFTTAIGWISVSPDGKLIHTGNLDPKARFSTWDAASGSLIRRFGLFRLGNTEALLSPDGKIIGYGFGGQRGDQLVLFDSATGKEKLRIKQRTFYFALANEVVALPAKDGIRLFSTKDGRYLHKLQRRARQFIPSKPQQFSPDGKLVLWLGSTAQDFADYDKGRDSDEVVWFDWKKKKLIHAIEFPQIELVRARFSGDGKVILVVGGRHQKKGPSRKKRLEGSPKLFAIDVRTGKQLYTKSLGQWSSDFTVSPNGKWFAFPGSDRKSGLSIYEVKSGKEVHQVLNVPPRMHPIATCWSPDSQTFYFEYGIVKRLRLQRDGSWRVINSWQRINQN